MFPECKTFCDDNRGESADWRTSIHLDDGKSFVTRTNKISDFQMCQKEFFD